MSTQPKPYLTPEQYLEIERAAETKSEYFNGEMHAMSGASLRHVTISGNLSLILGSQLHHSPCRHFTSDLRVQVSKTGLYTYPDILVICGKPELTDADVDTVTNPTLIIEILSSSTRNYDRGDKFAHYRTLPTLREYLLIAQDRIHAEHYVLQPDGGWLLHETSDPEGILKLEAIAASFRLREVYDGVDL